MDDRKIIYINLAEVTLKTNFVNDGKIIMLGFCVFHFYLFNFRNASAVALNLTTIDLGQKGDGKSCQTLIFCIELRDLLHWVVH